MTTTRSKVTRRTVDKYAVLYPRPREIVCSIEPGDVLSFREAGRRAVFRISIQTAKRYAVQLAAMNGARKVKELRRAGVPRKDARRRAESEVLK